MEPLLVVISCSSSPEDLALRDGLEKQLQGLVRQRVIRLWHAGQVRAGEATREVVLRKIREARIVLVLVSPDYLSSDEHVHELETALGRSAEARVMPVMLRSYTLHGTPLAPMKVLPEGGTPVNRWPNADEAWASVARAVRAATEEIRAGKNHYVPLEMVQTAPMGPLSWREAPPSPLPGSSARVSRPTPAPPVSAPFGGVPSSGRPSVPSSLPPQVPSNPVPPVVSSARPSAAPGSPTIPLSSYSTQPAPEVVIPPAPAPAASSGRGPGGAAKTVGLLLAGAILALLLWNGRSLLAEPAPTSDSPGRSGSSPAGPAATPAARPAVCCGGVDCPASERDVSDSMCAQNPKLCAECNSGRTRLEGACGQMLSSGAKFKIRVGQALIGGRAIDANARVCVRRSGTLEPETCTTVNEAQAGKAPAHPFPLSIHALTAGAGVDFWIERGGVILASETGAVVKAGGLKTSALCIGVKLQGSRSSGDSVTVYLDDP